MCALMIILSCVLIGRLFFLQIVRGEQYQSNYTLKLEKTEDIEATRGNIYDRKGKLLAYNELVYAISITDNGTYSSSKEKHASLNSEIAEIIKHLEKNGDHIDNNFNIRRATNGTYEFKVSGNSLLRFRADVFGHTSVDSLKFDEKNNIDQLNCSANEMISYLADVRYQVDSSYSDELRYKIIVIRYAMSQNSYQKYVGTTISSDVSEKTVAYIKENSNELTGVDIVEKPLRRYVDSEYFAHILGYTGLISPDEYEELKKTDESISSTDYVGKSGIEKVMNAQLSGKKGSETIFVDSTGNTIGEGTRVDPVAGNDVYLSIDKDLQSAAYKLLEQQLAQMLYDRLSNVKEFIITRSTAHRNMVIAVYDAYINLIYNEIIDIDTFNRADATPLEKQINNTYEDHLQVVKNELKAHLAYDNTLTYNDMPAEYQAYATLFVSNLKSLGIFDSSKIKTSEEIHQKYIIGDIPVNQYLVYAINQNWIDITTYEKEIKYADTEELYNDLLDYGIESIIKKSEFKKLVYKYLLLNDYIYPNQICALLYDQNVLRFNDDNYNNLLNGTLDPFVFIKSCIKNLDISPAELSLNPCSGSVVLLDVKTGDLLACVTYPGYDNNKMANSVDSDYYSYLINSKSDYLYNHATQEMTAPGSTFKIVTSTAGLATDTIDVSSIIETEGKFTKVDNQPNCWYYPGKHGPITVAEAIRLSCNYFFYEIGYRLAGGEDNYDDATGIAALKKYAEMYGLGEATGIEIAENTPHIATQYPVMAAIGQSDNNYTTISLARYATAIASSGNVYRLTILNSVKDAEGNVLEEYGPELRNKIDCLNKYEWAAIHEGMRDVVKDLAVFNGYKIDVAGKTGTAQSAQNKPSHAVFISYAPYDKPEIAMAVRIPHGYSASFSAAVCKDIYSYYFGLTNDEDLNNGDAVTVQNAQNALFGD